MKISDEMRFPHPVLSRVTGDFLVGEFNFSFDVEERSSDGRLDLLYDCQITEEGISRLVQAGAARAGLFVTCLETYFNKLSPVSLGKGQLAFAGGLLNGRVVLRPVLWTDRPMKDWRSPSLHPEFGKGPVPIEQHGLLGIGEEFIIHVGRDKLRPLESIFTLAMNEEIPDGRVVVHLKSDRIQVVVGKKTHASISLYRGSSIGRAILLNGVYLPAVMEVLRNLGSEQQLYEQYRWYRPFVAKCELLSIDLADPPLLEAAQRLLLDPYQRLMGIQEKVMS